GVVVGRAARAAGLVPGDAPAVPGGGRAVAPRAGPRRDRGGPGGRHGTGKDHAGPRADLGRARGGASGADPRGGTADADRDLGARGRAVRTAVARPRASRGRT